MFLMVRKFQVRIAQLVVLSLFHRNDYIIGGDVQTLECASYEFGVARKLDAIDFRDLAKTR